MSEKDGIRKRKKGRQLTSSQQPSTRVLALLDVLHDLVKLDLRHLGALEGLRVEGVANLDRLSGLYEKTAEFVVDGFVNKDAGPSRARLTYGGWGESVR
jgi:hypothetical protein